MADCRALLNASISKSTWAKHNSALNCLTKFEVENNKIFEWPLSENVILEFTSWAICKKGLKHSTVNSYLSSLNFAHKLKGFKDFNCISPLTKAILRGAQNLDFYKEIAKVSRKAMTLPLLKLAGHEMAKTSMEKLDKLVCWTAITIAFFGSFRFGKILSENEKSYNPLETLMWDDVKFRSDGSCLIKIKIPKSRNPKGEFIDLFPFSGHGCCPIVNLKKLFEYAKKRNSLDLPVFTLKNGNLMTKSFLNNLLVKLLTPHMGENAREYSGHSFRAAIASALANNTEIALDSDIKKWGRWSSEAYQHYSRLKLEQKRCIFYKITSVFNGHYPRRPSPS